MYGLVYGLVYGLAFSSPRISPSLCCKNRLAASAEMVTNEIVKFRWNELDLIKIKLNVFRHHTVGLCTAPYQCGVALSASPCAYSLRIYCPSERLWNVSMHLTSLSSHVPEQEMCIFSVFDHRNAEIIQKTNVY